MTEQIFVSFVMHFVFFVVKNSFFSNWPPNPEPETRNPKPETPNQKPKKISFLNFLKRYIFEPMPTQFISAMNRTEAGFHLLVMLSLSDGSASKPELEIIRTFLENAFSGKINLIKEQAFLKILPQDDMETHFSEVCARFYSISSEEDRNKVLDFAMQVVMADREMKPEENQYINRLYDAWGLD